MRRAVLIANPSASQFTGGLFRTVANTLSGTFDLVTEWPVSGLDTIQHTAAAVADAVDVVFAMGGDGVAHHVANGLAGSDTALGLIPAGTTNVLARILGVPSNPEKAAHAATTYGPHPTRVAHITAAHGGAQTERVATFSVGVGFDADVVQAAETKPYAKLRFGSIHYASTAVGRLTSDWRTRLPNLRIVANDEPFDAIAALTQVHHPYTYFGRVPLHLTKEAPEGMATLAVSKLGYRDAATVLTRAVLHRPHTAISGTHLWTGYDQITIDADPPSPFQADGELLGVASHLTIKAVEGGMLVLRPGPTD